MADKNLKLQVVWGMLDKITGPLKKIRGASGDTAKALKETRDRLKELNAQQKQIGQFRELSAGLRDGSARLKDAQQRVRDLAQQMKAVEQPTRAMTREFDRAVNRARAIKEANQQQSRQLQELRDRLTAAGISTSNLGQHERMLRTDIAATNAQLSAQQKRLAAVHEQQHRLHQARQRMNRTRATAGQLAGAGIGMTGAGIATGAPMLKSVRDYMSFEDAMLGVAKQLEGARDANGNLTRTYYDMADSIQRLGRELPTPTNAIAEMVAAGLRMGVAKDEVLDFVRRTSEMATAFEMPEGELAESMGKIAGLYKIPIPAIGALADTINYLDDNAISKGGDIIDFLQRVGGVAGAVAVKDKEMAALGSTLLTLGERTETAGTAVNAIMQKFAAADKGTKKFKEAMSSLGLSTKAIQKGMQVDALSTIMQVMDAIARQPKDMQIGYLTELVGLEHSDTFAKLANNVGEFRRQLELANGAAASGSMSREFQARLGAMSAQWEILKNRTSEASSNIGATLAPALTDLMKSVGRVLDRVSAWVKENPVLAGTLAKIAVVVSVLLLVLGGLALGVAALLGPFAIMQFVLAAVGVTGLGLMLIIGKVILVVGLLAAAAYLIYKNWEPIKGFFTGLWEDLKAAFNGGLLGIGAFILNWNPLGLFHRALAGVLSWFGIDIPAKFTEFGGNILRGLVDGIKGALGWAKDAIAQVGDDIISSFKKKLGINSPSRVFTQFGAHITEGLAIGIDKGQNEPLTQAGSMAKRLTAIGAGIAIGAAGMPAMAFDTRPPVSSQAGAASTGTGTSDTININIYPAAGMDPNAIARAVAAEMDRRDREKAARKRSSLHDY